MNKLLQLPDITKNFNHYKIIKTQIYTTNIYAKILRLVSKMAFSLT